MGKRTASPLQMDLGVAREDSQPPAISDLGYADEAVRLIRIVNSQPPTVQTLDGYRGYFSPIRSVHLSDIRKAASNALQQTMILLRFIAPR
jgi:hypothetical protein